MSLKITSQKQKHTLFILCFLFCFSLIPSNIVKAADTTSTPVTEVSYDIAVGGTQNFVLTDASGNAVLITITEEPSITRVANKTYSVSFKSPLSWEAGYKVDVYNNTISSVHSAWHKTTLGSISNARLAKESSTQATYYFTYRRLTTDTFQGVRTKVTSSEIKVTNV